VVQPDPDRAESQWSDDLAAAWEEHREYLFQTQRLVSDWIVDQVDPQPGQTILELAAGPGETGFVAAERVGPEGKLISTDVGPGMVAASRRGAQARGLTNVEWRLMDAQDIDLPDMSVDGVLCRFGVMLMPDPASALAGSLRVLRSGGRLAYGVWAPPDRNPWVSLLVAAILETGHAPPGDPFGPGGLFSLAAPERNRELLDEAGFSGARVEEIPGVMHFDDFEGYWTLQSRIAGRIALFLSGLSPDDIDAIRTTVQPMLAPFESDGAYDIPSLAIGACAQRP